MYKKIKINIEFIFREYDVCRDFAILLTSYNLRALTGKKSKAKV